MYRYIGVEILNIFWFADRLKIKTTKPTSYRALVNFTRTEKSEYHTYKLKKDKALRVVIRNLRPFDLNKDELVVRH